MSCELTHSVLHGYIDGELDAARAAEFERHLLSCPQCVAELEAQETLRSTIQRAGLRERAPENDAAQSAGGARSERRRQQKRTPISPKRRRFARRGG